MRKNENWMLGLSIAACLCGAAMLSAGCEKKEKSATEGASEATEAAEDAAGKVEDAAGEAADTGAETTGN